MDQIPNNWDKDLISSSGSFLQSAGWAEFQSTIGVKPHFLSGKGWSCLLLQKNSRFGSYLFSQYGPTVNSPVALADALDSLKAYGKRIGAGWLSLEPMGAEAELLQQVLVKHGAKPAARHREPDMTRLIGLSAPADELLASISQSTRSLIRKNQRENFLTFKTSSDPNDILLFTKMLGEVSRRKNVNFYSENYFKQQAKTLMPSGFMRLEIAYMENKPVATAVFHDFGQQTTYTYAGSLPQARKTSASALLLWQAMLNAKARKIKQMDLYGIAPDDAPASHPWAGFTSFKAKFGGQVVHYAGTWDIALNNRYHLYKTAHKARKLLKRR